jgi:hypothetical protein
MELKEIAVISGKGGLYKILKPTRTGVIVESIDEKKSRFPVNTSNRISVLEEISLFTKTTDGATPIKNVLRKIYAEFKDDPGVTPNSDADELRAFIQHIEPEYDAEKVYISDIKKIVSWYQILLKNFPELLTKTEEENNVPEEAGATESKEKPEEKPEEQEPEKKSGSANKKGTH